MPFEQLQDWREHIVRVALPPFISSGRDAPSAEVVGVCGIYRKLWGHARLGRAAAGAG
jgi:hypothetical protein